MDDADDSSWSVVAPLAEHHGAEAERADLHPGAAERSLIHAPTVAPELKVARPHADAQPMGSRVMQRRLLAACVASAACLVTATPAHAVATVSADTTRSPGGDALVAGQSPSLTAGSGSLLLLRFNVHGIGGPPAHAVLRLRATAATVESLAVRVLPPAFGEDDGTPAQLTPEPAPIAVAGSAKAGTWVQWDVTNALLGDGDVGFQVSGPTFDPASFSSREGPDAPQLVVTPDDDRAPRLAGLLDPQQAETFVAHARDDQDNSLDSLDVILAPPGAGVPGRYIGVHHALVGGVFTTKLVTSNDLISWTHRADLDTHASQPTLAALPGGGFALAAERDTPDAQYVSRSNVVVRHYADWDTLARGDFDRQVELPRTLAATAEGTPALSVVSWNGPDSSQIVITFHYLKNISVDRQAVGTLTNFSAAGWSPQPDAPLNSLMIGLGTRGNLGDRADLLFEGHPYAVVEAQSVKANFGTWRWYLYDRERNEARLLALHGPAGSYALGNPTVRPLPGPDGSPLLLISGYLFSEGSAGGEAGQFIALRHAATDPVFDPAPARPAPSLLVPAALAPSVLAVPAPIIVDSAPPAARLSAATQRLGRSVALRITCSDEACRATATGTARVPAVGRLRARTFTLRTTTKRLAAGRGQTVHLQLPPGARTRIRGALRAGRPIVVRLRVRFVDGAGNARTLQRRVKLRR